jgi:hypothetical protein
MDNPGAELISNIAFGLTAALLALITIYQGAKRWARRTQQHPGEYTVVVALHDPS